MTRIVLGLAVLFIVLLPGNALAIDPPPAGNGALKMPEIRSYENLDVAGDLLIIVEYELLYGSTTRSDPSPGLIPEEGINEAYFGRLFDGVTELDSVQPYGKIIPNRGYSRGIFSFYDVDGITVETGLKVILQGNPSIFTGDPPSRSASLTITSPKNRENLAALIRSLASSFSGKWYSDEEGMLYEEVSPRRLNSPGETYFLGAIPGLRDYTSELFIATMVRPDFEEEVFDTSYIDELRNYWEDTSFDNALVALAAYVNIPKIVLSTAILLGIATAIAFYVIKAVKRTEIGMFAGIFVIAVGSLMGLTPWQLVAILAMTGVLALGYMWFYSRSAS